MKLSDKIALYHCLVNYRFSLQVDDEICESVKAVLNRLAEEIEIENEIL